MAKKINIVLFGIGNVGSALINKVLKESDLLLKNEKTDLRLPVITNSTVAFFEKTGLGYQWEADFIQFAIPFKLEDIIYYLAENNFDNVIIADATPSAALAAEYPDLIKSGFSIISVNESIEYLPANFQNGIKFLAETREVAFKYIKLKENNKHVAASALYSAILEIAGNKKAFVS